MKIARAIAISAVIILVGIVCVTAQELQVYFIDVGQGDAILIDYGTYEMLIDGGRGGACLGYIQSRGVIDGLLDVVVATHMDADHIGGLDDVIENYQIGEIWSNGNTHTTNAYQDFQAASVAEGCPVIVARRGDIIMLGELQVSVLHPEYLASDQNANSVVLLLSYMGWDFLFTGDIESATENALVSGGLIPNVDFLKIAHHGSRSSSCESFLSVSKPQISVISVSATNSYGHPSQEVIDRLGCAAPGSILLRTDVHGTVGIRVDEEGKAYYWKTTNSETITANCPTTATPATSIPPSTTTQNGTFSIYRVEAVAECITLRNEGATAADLGGWKISDGEGSYTFPYGTIVQAGSTYKVCIDVYNPTHYTRGLYLNNDDDCVFLTPPGTYEPIDTRCW